MPLEFIWIENYGVIKDQGFNFNPNTFYSFTKDTGELKREFRNEVPPDFFSINRNTINCVSAIVGANGTGKSTVLEFISRFLISNHRLSGLVVIGGQILYKLDSEVKLSEHWQGERPKITNTNKLKILGNFIKDTRLIYYAGEVNLEHTNRVYQSLLSMSDEYENSHYTDISDIALMANDQNKYRTDKAIYSGENPVLAYRSGESERFLNLMMSDFRNLIPFPVQGLNLGVRFNDIDRAFFESYDEISFSPIMSLLRTTFRLEKEQLLKETDELLLQIQLQGIGGYFYSKLYKGDKINSDKNLIVHLYHHLLIRFLREQIMQTMGELTERNKLDYLVNLISDIENSFTSSDSYLKQIIHYFSHSKFAEVHIGTFNFKTADAFLENIRELHLWSNESFSMSLANHDSIKKFLAAISEFDRDSGLRYSISTIFDLEIRGLSTGEKQFLKILSRFVSANLNNKSNFLNEKQFIILIDEFEIGFHPLWQRKFLTTWIEFLERFVNQITRNEIKVQIILTSHSPFIVSDLPKQCINFLSRKENSEYSEVDTLDRHQKTFAANIHELFSDSFFLNGALMGDFAKNKIQKLINMLKPGGQIGNPDELTSIIQLIGEPILKTKLTEMLANRLGENVEGSRLRAQQEYINQRLKEIEKNDSNQTNTEKGSS